MVQIKLVMIFFVGMVLSVVVVFLTSLLLSLIITPPVKKLAIRVGAVDRPNERKIHTSLAPRLGGLGIYLSFTIAVLLFLLTSNIITGLLLGSAIIVSVGALDDIFSLSPKIKLLDQLAAAMILVSFGISIEFITNPFDGLITLGILSVPFTVFWIIGITNAVNLVDGLDGLAAGITVIASLVLAVISWTEGQVFIMYLSLILTGATLGFLKYNFYPAQMFIVAVGKREGIKIATCLMT